MTAPGSLTQNLLGVIEALGEDPPASKGLQDLWQAFAEGLASFNPVNQVNTIVAGTNITVDATDPHNPIISADDLSGVLSVTGSPTITVDNDDPANPIVRLPETGPGAQTVGDATHVARVTIDNFGRITELSPVAITGGGGSGVQSIVAGTNITVDDTDPENPVVSSTGGGGGGSFPNFTGSGSPEDVVTADYGQWYQDTADGDPTTTGSAGLYFHSGLDGTNTGWILVGGDQANVGSLPGASWHNDGTDNISYQLIGATGTAQTLIVNNGDGGLVITDNGTGGGISLNTGTAFQVNQTGSSGTFFFDTGGAGILFSTSSSGGQIAFQSNGALISFDSPIQVDALSSIYSFSGNPNSNVTARSEGDVCIDALTPSLWQALAADDSHWVAISWPPVVSRVYRNGAFTTGSSTLGNFPFDSVTYDPLGCYNISTHLWTAPYDGVYEVHFVYELSAPVAGNLYLASIWATVGGVGPNEIGEERNGGVAQVSSYSVTDIVQLSAGDTIEPVYFTQTALACSVGSSSCYMFVKRIA